MNYKIWILRKKKKKEERQNGAIGNQSCERKMIERKRECDVNGTFWKILKNGTILRTIAINKQRIILYTLTFNLFTNLGMAWL